MKLFLKYDVPTICKALLSDQLEQLGLTFTQNGFGEVDIPEVLSASKLKALQEQLLKVGIEIVETQKSKLVQQTKDAIIEMVYMEEPLASSKFSSYLAAKLNHSYGYISTIFSEVTYTSIENFIILQKIERAKQLILTNDMTITEIAWKLNYSSVAHFSTQFKNLTGLTPSTFSRIINSRRNKKPILSPM
jgi:AraC-like DNA-binding protein